MTIDSLDESDLAERLGCLRVAFGIDEKVRELHEGSGRKPRLADHWSNLDEARIFARRMLEVARGRMLDAREDMRRREHAEDWMQAGEDANGARKALGALLRNLSPHDPSHKHPSFLANVLFGYKIGTHPGIRASEAKDRAAKDAETLISAMRILDGLPDYLIQRGASVASSCRTDRIHDRVEFAFTMAEGWIYLCGRMPSSNKDENKNPFLRFVDKAWEDIGGSPDDSFTRPIELVLEGRAAQGELRLTSDAPFWR